MVNTFRKKYDHKGYYKMWTSFIIDYSVEIWYFGQSSNSMFICHFETQNLVLFKGFSYFHFSKIKTPWTLNYFTLGLRAMTCKRSHGPGGNDGR